MVDEDNAGPGMPPSPHKTDVLFGPGEDWPANACVNYGSPGAAYRTGFRRAALALAEQVCETGRSQDLLVYPIVYLYRHHMELALKSIIDLACVVLDHELTDEEFKKLGRHDLADLWNLAKPLLSKVVCDETPLPPDDLEGIDSYIRQLHEHDPDGQRFRYAMVKAKRAQAERRSLSPELRHINIRNFAIALEKLADYLDAIETDLNQRADYKAEMHVEWCRSE